MSAAAAAPNNRLCARAKVFMYVAVGLPASYIRFIATIEPPASTALMVPVSSRCRRQILVGPTLPRSTPLRSTRAATWMITASTIGQMT